MADDTDGKGKLTNGEVKTEVSLYERAVYRLNCLQSNAQTIAKNQSSRKQMAEANVQETRECLQKLGISLDDVDRLNVVHITGTKGKGSTAAFLEGILRALGYKTGFYSSPHLVHVRERIRIDGRPISEHSFAKQFFRVYDTLEATRQQGQAMPAYFKFLTLLAFRVFCDENVDVAIVEVGIGGEHDCTNAIRAPIACAISTLDLDHTKLLGSTIPEIAWHKAGIAKPGSTLLSVEQPAEALEVIRARCQERKCHFYVVPSQLDAYKWPQSQVKLGIPGIQHHINASLALQLARLWLHKMEGKGPKDGGQSEHLMNGWQQSEEMLDTAKATPKHLAGFRVPSKIATALAECRWPGRSQLLQRGNLLYHLDGAHTPQSIQYCARWFRETSLGKAANPPGAGIAPAGDDGVLRVLLFHCTGDRDAAHLLPNFLDCHFRLALFCPTRLDTRPPPLSRDNTNLNIDPDADMHRCERDRAVWTELSASFGRSGDSLDGGTAEAEANGGDVHVHQQQQDNHNATLVFPSISDAIGHVEQLAANNKEGVARIDVLVTGSFHLVGGVLALLDPECATI